MGGKGKAFRSGIWSVPSRWNEQAIGRANLDSQLRILPLLELLLDIKAGAKG